MKAAVSCSEAVQYELPRTAIHLLPKQGVCPKGDVRVPQRRISYCSAVQTRFFLCAGLRDPVLEAAAAAAERRWVQSSSRLRASST